MTARLVAAFCGIAAIVLAVLVIPLGINHQQSQTRELSSRVERDAFVLASLAQDEVRRADARARARLERIANQYEQESGGRVVFVRSTGRALFDSEPPVPGENRDFASRPEFQTALQGSVASVERFSRTLDENLLAVAVPVASGGEVHGAVRVSFPTAAIDREARDYWLRLILISLVMLAASAVVALVLARWAVAPLARVSAAADALGGGDLTSRAAEDDGPPEVQRLAHSFNAMADRLSELVDSQRRFVSDASHQLRTPLAALQLELDNLALGIDEPRQRERVEELLEETERLSSLIDGLLALARADAPEPRRETVDVSAIAAERIGRHHDLAARSRVTIDDRSEPVEVAVVTGGLEQMLDNCIDNALAASPAGGRITVSTHVNGRRAEVVVRDEGPGIDAEGAERAFDRFWRAPGSAAPGSGLGLAIVRQLAEASGGEAELRPAASGGTEAVLQLPLADVPAPDAG
jgi:signal transduction histidine kinase